MRKVIRILSKRNSKSKKQKKRTQMTVEKEKKASGNLPFLFRILIVDWKVILLKSYQSFNCLKIFALHFGIKPTIYMPNIC